MRNCLNFFKQEMVLCSAAVLAVISMFMTTPDRAYFDYFDFRTLAILFCLMIVMAGFKKLGIFKWLARVLLNQVKSLWQLVVLLFILCFFCSMVITNDVALLTFVPLTFTVIEMLDMAEKHSLIIPIVVMQTIAANLGSMLTPIGNPQNLYLYSQSGMGMGAFIVCMLPYAATALVLLLLWSVVYCLKRNPRLDVHLAADVNHSSRMLLGMYLTLYLLSLLAVAGVVSCYIVLLLVGALVLLQDRKTLLQVDYSLLFTFVAFFIFIGNMGRVAVFQLFLQNLLAGHEMLAAVVASQVISNVPAALLLSGFTSRISALIIGTNLGGLGTLVASMASLISYKYIVRYDKDLCGRYFLCFTAANAGFLAVLLALYCMLN